MASNYPTSLDTFTNPSAGASLSSPSHSAQHGDVNDAVEAIEAKLGIGSSAASAASEGAVLKANGSGSTTWDKAGLWFVNLTTFTASASFDISLPTTYNNYRIVMHVTGASTTNETRLQMLSGATPSTASYTNYIIGGPNSETISAAASWKIGGSYSTVQDMTASIDLISARIAQKTHFLGNTWGSNSAGGLLIGTNVGKHDVALAYDGIRFTTSTGTITGTVRVYGYQN